MQRFLTWLEALSALAGLVAVVVTGGPYAADYGHHNYHCFAQLLPCIVYSRADDAIAAVWLSLGLAAGFTAASAVHVFRKPARFLYVLLAIAAAYWIGVIVVEGGFFVLAYQISAGCFGISCLAAIARQREARRLRIKPAFLVASASVGVWILSLYSALSLAPCVPFGFPICIPSIAAHLPDAQDSLLYAVPIAEDGSGQFIGYDQFTADELNRLHQGSRLRPLHFVNADTPSTRPDVVSANPIDRNTWGAVAQSSSGRCYAILEVWGRPFPSYAVLPAGAPCVGSAATRETVTGSQWPAS